MAGSWWKCGFTTLHGTGGEKALSEPRKHPEDRHDGDPRMLPSRKGTLLPDPTTLTAGRVAAPAGILSGASTKTNPHDFKVLETGKLRLRRAGVFTSGSQWARRV